MGKSVQTSNPFSTLMLDTKTGKTMALSSEELTRYLEGKSHSKADSQKLFDAVLNYSGLKNPGDLRNLLESPTGKFLIAELGAELAFMENIKEEQRFELQEQQLMHRRLMAFLLLAFIDSEEAKAHEQAETIEQRIHELLTHHEKQPQKQEESFLQARADILNAFEAKFKELTQKQQSLSEEQSQLERDEKEISNHEAKHRIYAESLDQLDGEFSEIETSLTQSSTAKEDTLGLLQIKLEGVSKEIDQKTDEVTEHLKSGNDDFAKNSLHQLHGLHFKFAFLQDVQDFVKPLEKKIVKQDDKIYLLSAHQEVSNLSPEEKANAVQAWQETKNSLFSVKKMVLDQKQLERGQLDKTLGDLPARRTRLQEQNTLLSNQLIQLQAGQARVTQALDNPDLLANIITPSPTNLPGSAPRPKPANPQSFKQTAVRLSKLSHEGIDQFFAQINSKSPQAQKFIQKEMAKAPTNSRIPTAMLIYMLQNMERFGIDATKPSVTTLIGPLERKYQYATAQARAAHDPEQKAFNPSPLSTTPNPFKKQS